VRGRRPTVSGRACCHRVSIRAPVRGRLGDAAAEFHRARVSIRAPVRGRRHGGRGSRPCRCFNPRPREGATTPTGDEPHGRTRFNPRPREGATSWRMITLCGSARFNPRPREGATAQAPTPAPAGGFQSAPP